MAPVDWDKIPELPTIYDPPQFSPIFIGLINPLARCSFCCISPVARSICCGSCCSVDLVHISNPDDWFKKMLQSRKPECPPSLQGLWWMKDNAAAEGLLTFQDAIWESESQFVKYPAWNWTVDANNVWGLCLTAQFNTLCGMPHRVQMSPDGKWIKIDLLPQPSCNTNWIYVIQEGDVFTRPDGIRLDVTPGEDLMRLTYLCGKLQYQYIVRRVATLSSDGELVKTKAYEELLADVQKTDADMRCGEYGCPRFFTARTSRLSGTQSLLYSKECPLMKKAHH
eukprot:CAMPEP_0117538532 /NCGR_PEP_ID=MMETSP0784-20121206/42526_1 /TAXON_ID=39447 /ORGANISM="" /LENGTH=280 /DNA_ID=CAMNT_0005335147 /DNA_START=112 /DNA_END=954 /DNA_ORIENTATION=-